VPDSDAQGTQFAVAILQINMPLGRARGMIIAVSDHDRGHDPGPEQNMEVPCETIQLQCEPSLFPWRRPSPRIPAPAPLDHGPRHRRCSDDIRVRLVYLTVRGETRRREPSVAAPSIFIITTDPLCDLGTRTAVDLVLHRFAAVRQLE
jgi:hypothetical protein